MIVLFFLTESVEAGAVMDFTNLIEAEQWILLVKLPTFDQGKILSAFVNICNNWLWEYIGSLKIRFFKKNVFSFEDRSQGNLIMIIPRVFVQYLPSEYHWKKVILYWFDEIIKVIFLFSFKWISVWEDFPLLTQLALVTIYSTRNVNVVSYL